MSFTKISFFSLMISLCALNTNILAMDNVQQSIEKELLILDGSIIRITQELKQAQIQKEKDEKIFNKCMMQRKNGIIIDYSDAIKAYKGELFGQCFGTINYSNTGSEGTYNELKQHLYEKKIVYILYREDFERGKRLNNHEFLQTIALELQQENADNQ